MDVEEWNLNLKWFMTKRLKVLILKGMELYQSTIIHYERTKQGI